MATITYSFENVGQVFVVNAITAEDQFDPDVAVLDDGSLFFTFTTEGPNFDDIVFRRFSADRAPLDANDRGISTASGNDVNSTVALLTNGNVVVAYRDANHVEFDIRTPTGGTVSNGIAVPDLNDTVQDLPDVAALAGGGFVVACEEPFGGATSLNTDITFTVYNNDGTLRQGPTIAAGTATNLGTTQPKVTGLTNGNFVVSWAEQVDGNNFDIKARIYNADGVAVSNELTITNAAGTQLEPEMTALPGGSFAVVLTDLSLNFEGANKIDLRIYDAAGVLTKFTAIRSQPAEFISEPAISVISDNYLLVSYTSDRNSGDISARAFDLNGNPIGEEFHIGGVDGSQVDSALGAMGAGRFVTAWEEVDGSDPGFHVAAEVAELVRETDSDGTGETLVGDDLRDFISGNDGDDLLEGRGNADALDGGAGIDTASYASSAEAVNVSLTAGGGTGGDAQGDTLAGIENLIGSALGDQLGGDEGGNALAGGAGNDAMKGFGGDDVLDGGSGADQMQGGAGNDLYVVDDAGDIADETVDGSSGIDTVFASLSFTLGAGLENLTLIGDAAINGTGNELANVIIGNSVANVLDGGSGADILQGGAGNDLYVVDDLGDLVDESNGDGIDTVLASVGFSLGAGLENLTLTGSAAINGAGNDLANLIIGNTGVNILAGGLGNDILTGGAGADQFLFDTKLDAASNVDRIADFVHREDKILLDRDIFKKLSLGKLDRDDFVKAKKAQDDEDHVIYNKKTGALLYDKDGEGSKAAKLFAVLDDSPNDVSAKDFLIVA